MKSLIVKKSKFAAALLVLQACAALFLPTGARALSYNPATLDCMLCFRQLGTANPSTWRLIWGQ